MAIDALLVSTAAVAVAEIGDKTQLLSLILAARYRRPWPIIAGILIATIFNHSLAGAVGAVVAAWLSPDQLKWILALSFVAVAIWTLIPDKLDDADGATHTGRSVLIATVIAFFLAEMGDKTQVATVLLAAQYSPLWQVITGSTVGMLLANVPVVLLGSKFAHRLPLRAARIVAAILFLLLAIWILLR